MNLILESERFTLRPLLVDDMDWCVDMLTDPKVAEFIFDETPSVEDATAEMEYTVLRTAGGRIGIWAIIDRDSGEALGTTALLPMPVEAEDTEWELLLSPEMPDRDIEIGYLLRQPAWGRGVATEAARRLLEFAFEVAELPQVMAIIDSGNHASHNVARKLGFEDIGLTPAYAGRHPGYRFTREAWLARRTRQG